MSFNGHLVERTRPDGWPNVVRDEFTIRVDNREQLVAILNQKATRIKEDGGMTITFDEKLWNELVGEREKKSDSQLGRGFYVPMHQIAYMNFEVKLLCSPVPDIAEGAFRN